MNSHDLLVEARRQRAFKLRLDAALRDLPDGTTRAIVEDGRNRAQQTESAFVIEAYMLTRWDAAEEEE